MTPQPRSLTIESVDGLATDRLRVARPSDDPAPYAAVIWHVSDAILAMEDRGWIMDTSRFLLRLTPFAAAARQGGINLMIADGARALIDAFVRDARSRRDAQAGRTAAVPPDALAKLLAETRFRRRLTGSQTRDLGKLVALRHGANFSVPGAGKTTVALAIYEIARLQQRVDRLLVVAPKNAFMSWEEEIPTVLQQAPTSIRAVRTLREQLGGDPEIVLCTYQRLPRLLHELRSWMLRHQVHLVLDEAHRIKRGARGVHGSAALSIAMLAARRDILTGTPMPQSADDVVAPLSFLWPSQENELFPPLLFDDPDSPEAIAEVQYRIEPLYVRTTKAELDLPPFRPEARRVALSSYQEEIYRALRGELRESWLALPESERWDFQRLGRYWVYLVQAAVNPSLLLRGTVDDDFLPIPLVPPLPIRPGTTLFELLRGYHEFETPAKLTASLDLVREIAATKKVVVWSSFVVNIEVMASMLGDFRPAVVHGGVPSAEVASPSAARVREDQIRRFKEDADCRVLVANPAACGEGISLHHVCHDAVYVDRTFNAGHYLQSVDRIHRLGLPPGTETRAVILEASGTIDERISRRIDAKIARMAAILDDRSLEMLALDVPDERGVDESAAEPSGHEIDDLRAVVDELEEE